MRVADTAADGAGVVIDALLGTGSEGDPRGKIAEGIAGINQMRSSGARVAALDIPSGLDATTGTHSTCVVADVTLSFGSAKRGSFLARDCCGEIIVLDIGLDNNTGSNSDGLPVLVDGEWVRSHIPPIRYDAHKGSRKHLAIVGGGPGMPGAVVLASRAALRSGIGLVRALVAPGSVGAVLEAAPSALISEWPASEKEIAAEISKWADAIVIGPGLGNQEKQGAGREDSRRLEAPGILDADALNVFEGDAESLRSYSQAAQRDYTACRRVRAPHRLNVEKYVQSIRIGVELANAIGATGFSKDLPQ